MHARFRIPIEGVEVCVAANEAVHFSVCSFGCTLFTLWRKIVEHVYSPLKRIVCKNDLLSSREIYTLFYRQYTKTRKEVAP